MPTLTRRFHLAVVALLTLASAPPAGVRLSVTARSVLYSFVRIPIVTSTGGAWLAPTLDLAIGIGTRL